MGHVGIVSAAYWGDVMPFVPIAEELRRRGHRVTMVVPRGFHEVLAAHDVELVHLGTDLSPRELEDHGEVIERSATIRGMRAALDLWVRQLTIEPAHRILDALAGVAPDLWLVHNTASWLVELHARTTGTPLLAGHLFPMMIPTAHRCPPMLPAPAGGYGATGNRAAWWLGRRMTGRMGYDTEVNALRAEHGLAPAIGSTGFGWERADEVLVLTSRRYWPVPDDWPDHVRVTGLTVWGDRSAPLADRLRASLMDGPPTVLVTLGTSAATGAWEAFDEAARGVESIGLRPVLLVGSGRTAARLEHRADVWTFAPLPAVLPHVRAVVHAAGHGTTAAALHAAVPQVVMPRTFDQSEHARRLQELGVGVVVPWRRLSAERVARALRRLDRDDVTATADDLARALAEEDGPATAADRVEVHLADVRT